MAIDGTDLENEISCGFGFFLNYIHLKYLNAVFTLYYTTAKKIINMWNCSINIIVDGRINKSVFKMT